MKILKRGIVPEVPEIKYTGECTNCGTIIQVDKYEITYPSYDNSGSIVTCPICSFTIDIHQEKD